MTPTTKPTIDYTNKDYQSLVAALLEVGRERLPDWTDQSANDPGVVLTELFAYPDSATDETTEADEIGRVGASGEPDTVDLEQPIIDAIGLALPFAPLCGPDCAGLCPQCSEEAKKLL